MESEDSSESLVIGFIGLMLLGVAAMACSGFRLWGVGM